MTFESGDAYQNLLNFNSEQQASLQKVCQPLFDCFPIKHLFYGKYFLDGKYFVIGSQQQALELYFHHNTRHPNRIFIEEFVNIPVGASNKFVWPVVSPGILPTIDLLRSIGICNGLNVTINKGEYLESFIFSANPEDQLILNFYINSFDLLERFIDYFSENCGPLTNHTLLSNLPYSKLYEEQITHPKPVNLRSSILKIFNDQTHLSKRSILIDGYKKYVSIREYECLAHLSRGKSIKEIAVILDLSPHTVVTHVEHIKLKLGVPSKSKAIDLFLKNLK